MRRKVAKKDDLTTTFLAPLAGGRAKPQIAVGLERFARRPEASRVRESPYFCRQLVFFGHFA